VRIKKIVTERERGEREKEREKERGGERDRETERQTNRAQRRRQTTGTIIQHNVDNKEN
jgi:hypothetical protein